MAKQVVKPEHLLEALAGLGVRAGDLLMVHSSLSSFGHFEGGPDAVIACLLEAVARGTVVMPTYTQRSLNRDPDRDLKEFNAATEPSINGIITECFRVREDVIRQPNNPWHPLAVWGRYQKRIIEMPPYSLYAFFCEHSGHTLFIGTGHETNSLIHSMLDDAMDAGLLTRDRKVRSYLFPRLEPWFVRQQAQTTGQCGCATLRLLDVNTALKAVLIALKEQPDLFDVPPSEEESSRILNTIEKKKHGS